VSKLKLQMDAMLRSDEAKDEEGQARAQTEAQTMASAAEAWRKRLPQKDEVLKGKEIVQTVLCETLVEELTNG
jgi:hypothetical protein